MDELKHKQYLLMATNYWNEAEGVCWLIQNLITTSVIHGVAYLVSLTGSSKQTNSLDTSLFF